MVGDFVFEPWPPMGLLFISQMMSMELWWSDTDREEVKNSDKNLSQCHFVFHKPHMD
jgi:hypothetical protein